MLRWQDRGYDTQSGALYILQIYSNTEEARVEEDALSSQETRLPALMQPSSGAVSRWSHAFMHAHIFLTVYLYQNEELGSLSSLCTSGALQRMLRE